MSSSSGPSNKATAIQANAFWQKQPKANAELFALTYGALVAELLRDLEDPQKITEELDRMGHSIGVRCIEEVLAKGASAEFNTGGSGVGGVDGGDGGASVISRSQNFPESAEIIKVAFRMFLGLVVECSASDATQYSIKFPENPLAIFVELPEEYRTGSSSSSSAPSSPPEEGNQSTGKLEYSQLLAGMVRGMLEMLQFDCTCRVVSSVLMGGDTNEISVELKQILQEGAGEEYQEE